MEISQWNLLIQIIKYNNKDKNLGPLWRMTNVWYLNCSVFQETFPVMLFCIAETIITLYKAEIVHAMSMQII
jgi:hypothetical protein